MDKKKKKLLALIASFSGKKVAVWGDFILDEHIFGTTRRISREAPVLILTYKNREYSLGGGGNSLLNLKALGAVPLPVGVLGSDLEGKKIFQILKKKGISTEFLLIEKSCKTPLKTRILAGEETARKQQILRIDKEGKVPESREIQQKIREFLGKLREQTDALLISDYHYFTVREDVYNRILPDFQKSHIPVTLDSRFRLMKFKGMTVATPNEPEVEEALKVEIDNDILVLNSAGKALLKETGARAILITRGSEGMALFEKGKKPFVIPIYGTSDIVDVTGAGDTVISVLTLALACGASLRDASLLANYAGGLVVMKKGTATVSPKELKEAIVSKH